MSCIYLHCFPADPYSLMVNFKDFWRVGTWISYSPIIKYIYSGNSTNIMESLMQLLETSQITEHASLFRLWPCIFSLLKNMTEQEWDGLLCHSWLKDGMTEMPVMLFVFPLTKQIVITSWVQNISILGTLKNDFPKV